MDIGIVSGMSEYELSCVIIKQDNVRQQKLLQLVRASYPDIKIGLANSSLALKALLTNRSPLLLFYSASHDEAATRYEHKLLRLLQRLAPDCILVQITQHDSLGLNQITPAKGTQDSGVQSSEVCTIASANDDSFKLQLDYVVAYARLKFKFRQCKHLLSIAELRSQWLVEYAREAVAYIAADEHLYVNVAYLSLFGLHTVSDARMLGVLNLIQSEDQAVFQAVQQAAEQHAKPSNKLLLTLRTIVGQRFRAEIRCVPAVYRGQRCVQLHVHPLLSSEQESAQAHVDSAEKVMTNPWEQQSDSALELAQQVQEQEQQLKEGQQSIATTPTILACEVIQQLQPAFKEFLNLRGRDFPAMLRAQPWLQYGNTRLDYKQLLANAHDQSTRFQLDYWNLQTALNFLTEQHSSPLVQQVVVSLGSWALTNVQQVAQLLKLLRKHPVINKELVLGLDSVVCLRRQKTAKFLLPLYKDTGASLMFEQVQATDEGGAGADIFAMLELSGSSLVQLHADYASAMNTATGVPERLQMLLLQMSECEVATVVAGVQNLDVLNLLSETTATYLQGPILDRFSH